MSALHCFFCGGKECKYENWKLWTSPDKYQGVNAIDGLFSNWITSQILAMQRPSTRLIKEYNLIQVFKEKKISAIFNLQSYGEHLSCGDGVDPSSGFSYLPETFIEQSIKYYNFGWTDMDTPDVNLMLNIVNVMAYALEDKNEKVAVHCHAGLGRTGLTIACYLIFSENIPADAAILIVRGKRPLSVQTKKQSMFVIGFEKHLKRLKIVYPHIVEASQKLILNVTPLKFREFIDNQRKWIQNPDLRFLRYIPKVIHVIVQRILAVCADEELNWYNTLDAFVLFEGIEKRTEKMKRIQEEVNGSDWGSLKMEIDVKLLVDLLLDWFISLKEPLLNDDKVKLLADSNLSWDQKCEIIGKEEFETINLILKIFRQIPSISKTTLDTALEVLTTIFTSERRTLRYFEGTNPAKPASIPQPESYGARMFDTFKYMTARAPIAPIAPIASDVAQRVQSDLSMVSVASFAVIHNIQKSAEALTSLAAGSISKMTNDKTGKEVASLKELPALPAASTVTDSKEMKSGVAENPVQLPAIGHNSNHSLPQSPKAVQSTMLHTSSSSKPPLFETNRKQALSTDKLPPLQKPKSLENALDESKPERLPSIQSTLASPVSPKLEEPSLLAAKTTSEDLLHKNENIKQLLHYIYKSYSTSRDSNSAISSNDATKKVLEHHNWISPVEMLQNLPRESLADNLADMFTKQSLNPPLTSTGSLTRSNISYSASDLPILFRKANLGGNTVVGKELSDPPAPGPLSKRKSSSVGFLPMDTAAIPKGSTDMASLNSVKGATYPSVDAIVEES